MVERVIHPATLFSDLMGDARWAPDAGIAALTNTLERLKNNGCERGS